MIIIPGRITNAMIPMYGFGVARHRLQKHEKENKTKAHSSNGRSDKCNRVIERFREEALHLVTLE